MTQVQSALGREQPIVKHGAHEVELAARQGSESVVYAQGEHAPQDLLDAQEALARTLGNLEPEVCIDDAAQEVYLECFRRGGAFAHFAPERARHGVTGFLRGVVRNVAHRFERQWSRERAHRAHLTVTPLPVHSSDDAVPAGDSTGVAHEHVVAALDRLDHDDPARGTQRSLRAFLHLHFDDGLPVRTIAKHWQETPDHVHELRSRACRRFRNCLLAVLRDAGAPQPAT